MGAINESGVPNIFKELTEALYRTLLLRDGDSDGLRYAQNILNNKEKSIEDHIKSTLSSDEFKNNLHVFLDRYIGGKTVKPDGDLPLVMMAALKSLQLGRSNQVSDVVSEKRVRVNKLIQERTSSIVQTGLFRGMLLLDTSNRGDGDIGPKLLGLYEQELHAPLLQLTSTHSYDSIVDIGAAEGYFAVGMARLVPQATIFAYDTDQLSLGILKRNAALNGCEDRILCGGACDAGMLRDIASRHQRTLAIIDCEGYEKVLISELDLIGIAGKIDIVVECHDLWDATISATIRQKMSLTHDVEVLPASGRNPNQFKFLDHLPDLDRWIAVWERRGARMDWLVCRAR